MYTHNGTCSLWSQPFKCSRMQKFDSLDFTVLYFLRAVSNHKKKKKSTWIYARFFSLLPILSTYFVLPSPEVWSYSLRISIWFSAQGWKPHHLSLCNAANGTSNSCIPNYSYFAYLSLKSLLPILSIFISMKLHLNHFFDKILISRPFHWAILQSG